jgi:hypothetical protein
VVVNIWTGAMSWDDHEGRCIEVRFFGLVLMLAMGRRVN